MVYIRKLAAESQDYRLLFDEANLAQLAQRPAEAYESWTRYLSKRWDATEVGKMDRPLVVRVAAHHWSDEAYREAVRIITMECEASVSAFSETPFAHDEGFSIEPRLYNPVRDKSGRESTLIAIAEPLAQHKRMYVTTTEAEMPLVLGLPGVARADIFFQSHLNEGDAWNVAAKVDPADRIVKVDFFRSATSSARTQAERLLKSSLSAEMIA